QTVRELLREPPAERGARKTTAFDRRSKTARERSESEGRHSEGGRNTGEDDEDGGDEPQGPGLKGEVLEDTDHYYILGRRGEPVTISTFALEPVRRIATDEGDIIDADVTTTCGRTYRGVRFPRNAWHSKRHLLRVLKSADMLW